MLRYIRVASKVALRHTNNVPKPPNEEEDDDEENTQKT